MASLIDQHDVQEAVVTDDRQPLRDDQIDDAGKPSEASEQSGLQTRAVTLAARQTEPLRRRNDPHDNLCAQSKAIFHSKHIYCFCSE